MHSLMNCDVWHLERFARERDIVLILRLARRTGGTNLPVIYLKTKTIYGHFAGTCMLDHMPIMLVHSCKDNHFHQSLCIPESI